MARWPKICRSATFWSKWQIFSNLWQDDQKSITLPLFGQNGRYGPNFWHKYLGRAMTKRPRKQSDQHANKRANRAITPPAKPRLRDLDRTGETVQSGYGTAKDPDQRYQYRTVHRMLNDGFCVFTLENTKYKTGQYSRWLAAKYYSEFFKVRDEKSWLTQAEPLVEEPNCCQIKSTRFE